MFQISYTLYDGYPSSAPFAAAFFATDIFTLAITGQGIGDHLDNAVKQPLLDFNNRGN